MSKNLLSPHHTVGFWGWLLTFSNRKRIHKMTATAASNAVDMMKKLSKCLSSTKHFSKTKGIFVPLPALQHSKCTEMKLFGIYRNYYAAANRELVKRTYSSVVQHGSKCPERTRSRVGLTSYQLKFSYSLIAFSPLFLHFPVQRHSLFLSMFMICWERGLCHIHISHYHITNCNYNGNHFIHYQYQSVCVSANLVLESGK